MRKSFSRVNAVLLAVLLCASVLPQGAVAEEGATEHFAFGVEYEWSNMNADFESMTGLPLDDILADVMQSADDAGIEMLILEEITGTSSLVIDQYEDGTMMFEAADGTSVEVTKHVTELTIRHGELIDMAMISEWSDARAGWDLTISGGSEGIFNADAFYVEYRDVSGLLYGHDVDMSLTTEQTVFFDLQGHLEAEDGDAVMPLNIHMEMGVNYSVTNAQSSVVYSEPSTLFQKISDLEGGEQLDWRIGEDDDEDNRYVSVWDSMDSENTNCSWEPLYSEYDCETDWDQDGNVDETSNHYYCEYYADWEVYYCTNDFGYSDNFEDSLILTHYQDDTVPERGIFWQDYTADETDCYWNGYEYECETDYDGDGYLEDWNYWGYCEDYTVGYQCTDDFGYEDRYEDSMDWTHFQDGTSPINEVLDNIESHTGSFSTATGFNVELTGLPAEEMGMPEGKWDISVSDDETDAGAFDEDFDCEMSMELFEGTQMITTDGDQIEVMQAYTSPLPFGMTCHIANLFMHAFEGTEDAATLEDMIVDSTKEIAESIEGNGDSWEQSQMINMNMNVDGQDEIYISVYAWNLDSDINYEVQLVLEDTDGITQDADSIPLDSYWGEDETYTEMSTTKWGETCATAQLKDVSNNAIVDSVTSCVEVSQEPEPSELVESILDGFADSTIENVMENFASNLEYRLEDYEADIAYNDADGFVLWDNTNNMVVGFQMIVSTEDSNMWYTLVGPESDSYGTAPSPVSLTYFSGQQAITQEAEIEADSTLADLVDLSTHNDDLIEEAIEEALSDNSPEAGGPADGSGTATNADADAADEGLLPFISPVLTITMIAVAGLVASLRTRKE